MRSTFSRLFSLRNQLLLSASVTHVANSRQPFCSLNQVGNHFKYAAHMIPHPSKAHKGGEDAYFANEKVLMVADGVGGWADYGIDPGLYSKEYCKHSEALFTKDKIKFIANPKQLIIEAHQLTKAKGSTTVCAVTIEDQKLIVRTSFVGDSGYAQYRKKDDGYEIVFKSQEQQKSFNFPYQIGSEGDNPSCAWVDQHDVQNNDVFVIGTDGLFDNLAANQIKLILDEEAKDNKPFNCTTLAKTIASYAYKLSLDQNYQSPFAKSARQNGMHFRGGKSDDITVIVAQVVEAKRD